MGVKSEILKEELAARHFPKLMTNGTFVVLFKSHGIGCVVHKETSNDSIGTCSATWDMKDFEDFEGTITLSNE